MIDFLTLKIDRFPVIPCVNARAYFDKKQIFSIMCDIRYKNARLVAEFVNNNNNNNENWRRIEMEVAPLRDLSGPDVG